MKLVEMEFRGAMITVQLSEEEAALYEARVGSTVSEVDPRPKGEDHRAPSAKLVDDPNNVMKEDEMGQVIIQSAAAENEERIKRRKAVAAKNTSTTK